MLARIGRWAVGAVLVFAATQKIADFAASFLSNDGAALSLTAANAAIPVELGIGAWLLGSSSTRSLAIGAALITTFLLANAYELVTHGSAVSCGCFGGALAIPRYWALVIDGALLFLLGVAAPQVASSSHSVQVSS